MRSRKGDIPRWLVQIIGWVTGVTGLIADYGFGFFGPDHLPLVLYCMAFGAAFALDPSFYVDRIFGREKEEEKEK